ncbi:MAG: universal stress protein [uncultured bacterium]|nr:MAG: universal stress protein [uncultured bacterium]HBH18767.1 hypothetical protein [Cyanobacteria bacterium UBA9579]
MNKIKVLMAIDEPNLATIIVHTASNLIDKDNSEITLLNVNETNVPGEYYFINSPQKFIEHEAEKSDFAYLENYLETEGFNYKGFLYREGSAADNILDVAEKERYDLIVVGSHNKHATQRFFLGSVSYKISRLSKVSVLVIKPTDKSNVEKNENYSVLFATDSSDYSEYASNNLGKFIDKKRAIVNVLNVLPPIQEIIPTDAYIYTDITRIMEESELVSKEIVRETAINIARQGVNIDKKYHVTGNTASSIIKEAEKNLAKLIIMGAHGKTHIPDWLMGSVSTKVYENSPISVLIIKK